MGPELGRRWAASSLGAEAQGFALPAPGAGGPIEDAGALGAAGYACAGFGQIPGG